MLFDEFNDIAQSKPSLPAIRAVVRKPAAVRISPDGSGADAQKPARFFQAQFRIKQPFDKALSIFFEVATVIVGGHGIIIETAQKFDALRQCLPRSLQFRIDGRWSGRRFGPSWTGRAH